uniref:Uncharacterized protein n=1 Tax=Oxytricha trifallax TaxID=1172189 RepID=G9HRB8_9SPIT|nr:hypothetical protein [Oxytricha trifallax]
MITEDFLKKFKNLKYQALEVFFDTPFHRRYNNIEVIFEDSDKSINIYFTKKDFLTALKIFTFYTDEEFGSKTIWINDFELKKKKMSCY